MRSLRVAGAVFVAGLVAGALASASLGAVAATPEQQLADRYSPVMAMKVNDDLPCNTSGEQYSLTSVDIVLGNPQVQLVHAPPGQKSEVVKTAATESDLTGLGESYFLNQPGDPFRPGCTYARDSQRLTRGRQPVTYAHVARESGREGIALQFWFYYWFNRFNDLHESDWEMIQLAFDASTPEEALARGPTRVAYAQHGGGETADWDDGKLEKEAHAPGGLRRFGVPREPVRVGSLPRARPAGRGAWMRRHARQVLPRPAYADPCPDPPVGDEQARVAELPWPLGPEGERPLERDHRPQPEAPVGGALHLDGRPAQLDAEDAGFQGGGCHSDRLLLRHGREPRRRRELPGQPVLAPRPDHRRPRRDHGRPGAPDAVAPRRGMPLRKERAAGQLLRVAGILYRRYALTLLSLALVIMLLAVGLGLLLQLISDLTSLEIVFTPGDPGIDSLSSFIFAAPAYALVLALVGAPIVAVLRRIDAGEPATPWAAFREVVPLLPRLLWVEVLGVLAMVGLALTVIGIPYAIKKGVDWTFAGQEVVFRRCKAREALSGSSQRVRGRWWAIAGVVIALFFLGAVLAPLIAAFLIMFTDFPLWTINALGVAFFGLALPYMVTTLTLLYLEPREQPEPSGSTWWQRLRRRPEPTPAR